MRMLRPLHNKFFLVSERKPVWQISLRIAVIYLLFGLLWIFFSDKAVELLVQDPGLRIQISIIKGFVFIFVSATIIFMLVFRPLAKLSDDEQVILESRNEMKILLYYDHLTGLSNRRKLMERMPEFLADGTDKGKALLYLDVDNIKLINDTMGHTYGDTLIAAIARRLASILQPPDELYRIGGDEFAILVKFRQMSEIKDKAALVLGLFESPFAIENTLIHRTISLGISLYPIHGTGPEELLKYADIAMNQSKKTGKNRSVLYNLNMMSALNERMAISEQLHTALANRELELFYQPQIHIQTRKIVGMEALLRWKNPTLGQVSPDRFITIAEETHLIIPIGEWVLREACIFLKSLHHEGFGNLTMSVNISITQLLQEDFVPMVKRILAETGIDPSKLELEITESVLMESHEVIRGQLDFLQETGIEIALDDFGKGYSSLSYLEQLPISVLKIDKTFIDGIVSAGKDTSITGNIVRIGKKLGLRVVAEGVENDTQLEYLAYQQCDIVQGWIFSKALPRADAETFTKNNLGIKEGTAFLLQ